MEPQQSAVVQQQPGAPGQVNWMPAPQAPIGCPPGLEYLLAVDQILIHQQVELVEGCFQNDQKQLKWSEKSEGHVSVPTIINQNAKKMHLAVLTGCERNNKYKICNTMNQQVYFAQEETGCLTRQCCGPGRPFEMKIFDGMQREVIHLSRPLRMQICCCPCCLQEIEIQSPPGTVIGYVVQKQTWWKAKLEVQDAERQPIMMINGPCCPWSCGSDVVFPVTSVDGSSEIGKIYKQWSGFAQELFTDAANFGIRFPLDLDIKFKAILMGAVFLVDFMFFERSN